MRTFKDHILEKLKVSSNNYVNITYKEFFDLLDEYSLRSGEALLDLNETIDFDEPLPKYKKDESKQIYGIMRLRVSNPIIRLRTYNFTLQKSFSDNIYINDVANKEVDFMEDEYIEKAVKYMEEYIK